MAIHTRIKVEHGPDEARLTELGVREWPIWTKETSSFPWSYEALETCYFLEGEVIVTPEGGKPVEMGKGDLVTFAAGLVCHWDVRQPVKKHYTFG